jgi:hypothetical protein
MATTLAKKNKQQNVALVDVLDRLLEKGVVARGEVAIRLADIDLIALQFQLLATSISKITQLRGREVTEEALTEADEQYLTKLTEAIHKAEQAIPKEVSGSDAEELEKGLTRLVLTLVELIRRLMEREAVRQVKMQQLSGRETQKLGMALKAIATKMEAMKTVFGLTDEDLNLDLGPLGELL